MATAPQNGREAFRVWGLDLDADSLTDDERNYLTSLPDEIPDVRWVWDEIDRVWDEMGIDSRRSLSNQPVDAFYGHPVWLMNGVFSAVDPESAAHRRAITAHIAQLRPGRVVDFGGGFGTLALMIAEQLPGGEVAIVEPYPSSVARRRIASSEGVAFIDRPEEGGYDVAIAQDVLEHVERPIETAVEIARSVRAGGHVVFASNFTPVIKCHLPRTFHLLRTFRWVMAALGLQWVGVVEGAGHAQVYAVKSSLHPRRAYAASSLSRVVGPILNWTADHLPTGIKRRLRQAIRRR